MRVEPGRAGETWTLGPALTPGEPFPFVCAGCGGCCRGRRDLVLSGYDLYRIARRLRLSPRIAAHAFCKEYIAPQSLLPALCLTPDPQTGDCRFLEGGACAIHEARPLACALYWDYALGDEFYPQFQQNIAALLPLLDRLLAKP